METIDKIKSEITQISLQQEIKQIETEILEIFKQMKMIELATLEHQDDVGKKYPKEYKEFQQAIKDMSSFYNVNSNLDDLKEWLYINAENKAMFKEALAKYEKFHRIYNETLGIDEDFQQKRQLKDDLIEEIITQIYPNISRELRPIVKKWYQDKSIEELKDIKRANLNELDERHPKF